MTEFENEPFHSFDDPELELDDFITLMFERTSEEGVLYIPGWHYDGPGQGFSEDQHTDENDSYLCHVDWNLSNYEELLQTVKVHVALLRFLSKLHPDLLSIENPVKAEKELKEKEFIDFWKKYLCPLSPEGFDYNKLYDIEDRMDVSEYVKTIAGNFSKGVELDEFEKSFLADYLDTKVTPEEEDYYHSYVSAIYKEAEERIGGGLCAYDVVIRTRRLFRLLALKAPWVVVIREARFLAAAMLLNRHGKSRETVGNYQRLRIEREERMSEEELDEIYRQKKGNSPKSLLPLFIYQILKTKTDSKHHLRKNDILEELQKYPYELFVERKAVSRTVESMAEQYQFSVFSDRTGVWIEQEKPKSI